MYSHIHMHLRPVCVFVKKKSVCGLSLYHIVRFGDVKGGEGQRQDQWLGIESKKEASGGTGKKDSKMGKTARGRQKAGKKGE